MFTSIKKKLNIFLIILFIYSCSNEKDQNRNFNTIIISPKI
jgi:hypothetical protein